MHHRARLGVKERGLSAIQVFGGRLGRAQDLPGRDPTAYLGAAGREEADRAFAELRVFEHLRQSFVEPEWEDATRLSVEKQMRVLVVQQPAVDQATVRDDVIRE